MRGDSECTEGMSIAEERFNPVSIHPALGVQVRTFPPPRFYYTGHPKFIALAIKSVTISQKGNVSIC